jgi:chitinase
MRWLLMLVSMASLLAFAPCIRAADPAPGVTARASNGFRIAGYLPDYRMIDYDLEQAVGLTDLILFSAEPTAEGEIDFQRLKSAPWERLRQWKTRHRTRLILCLGGWDRSAAFARVSATAESRQRFARKVVAACLERRLDGVDIDWEHPRDAAEAEQYGLLLKELRAAFLPQGLLLSMTLAAWQPLTSDAIAAVDYVQVMAYDHPDRHSTFEGATADIERIRKAGAAAEKIVLGLPFYGREVKQFDKVQTWQQISARFPELNGDESDGLFFNGPRTIRRKTEWALSEKLGGVMVWELGQDAPGARSLLTIIRQTVHHRITSAP